MSLLHPNEDDYEFAAAHREAGFKMRIRWVISLREALAPFAAGTATEEDRARARRVLDETQEWLGDWASEK